MANRQISTTVPEHIVEKVNDMALKEQRSISQMTRVIIENYFKLLKEIDNYGNVNTIEKGISSKNSNSR